VKAETVCDTLSCLETKALVNPLGDTLAVVEADTFAGTLGDLEAKALPNVCSLVLLRSRSQHMVIYLEMLRPRQ